ncbi:Target SNARE coiled-coil domain protein [Moelleriella libera RCEF 2490]|uniref:Target SNARE coiled-coil domain protein n=1 Tax=Moelleriella libera RCEF 2490 TaxID=1081109 RepID=A0A168B666_9HYPO|nr:Target SNARE coiled-coil domain protein [Moelleriella libera RCEF 2490]
MKKFGFGKKGEEVAGDDINRNALFGRKKPSQSQPDNPYAQQEVGDPYADNSKYATNSPYQQARAGVGSDQSQGTQSSGRPYGSSTQGQAAQNGSQGGQGMSYGSDRYGSGAGYGSNRYNSPAAGARGPGGYGGFGRTNGEADENRDVLFSGAQERQAQRRPITSEPAGYGQAGSNDASYGGYGEQRELSAEEQEAADYQAILAQKRQIQQESASSVSRSVQMARQANEVGQATLARLGAQGERLHNTEKNLDLAANQNKIAQDRAAELKTLNRSMFAVHVNNPFTSKQRQQKADDEVMSRHRTEREQREATRRDGYSANQRMETTFKDIHSAGRPPAQARKKDYGKFNLDDEEGADEIEDQIDDGLNELESQVSMMNMVGRAIGKEVDSQNKQIDRIMGKVTISLERYEVFAI